MKRYKINLLYCLIITLIVWIAYSGLVKSYFQQDEWFSFGQLIFMQSNGLAQYFQHYFNISLLHLTPLSSVFFYLPFKFFGLNPVPYAVISIAVHTINSLLVFLLIYCLTKDNLFALVTALIFASNRLPHQAITWFAAYTGSLGSVLFMLLSMIFYVNFIGAGKRKFYFLSIAFLITGLLFKETIVFLFLLLPLVMLIFSKEKNKNILKQNLALLAVGAAYMSYRIAVIAMAVYKTSVKEEMVVTQLSFVSEFSKKVFLFEFIHRLFTVPLKILAQSFFSQGFIIRCAEKLLGWLYPQIVSFKNTTLYDITTQTIGCDIISYLVAFILILSFILARKYFTRRNLSSQTKLLDFSFLLIILSALPFIFVPGKWGRFSLVESRYLYVPSLGVAILIAEIIFLICNGIKERFPRILRRGGVYLGTVIFLAAPLLITNILLLKNKSLERDIQEAAIRKKIIYQIKNAYPALPKKSIFYVESDTAYYGLAGPTFPFQSGFGYTLMVIYRDYLNPRLFKNDILFRDFYAQGYFSEGESGFGYFLDYDRLQKLLKGEEDRLAPNNVYAFRWEGKKQKLIDITSLVRLRLISKDEKNFIKNLLKRDLNLDSVIGKEWVYFDDFYASNPHRQELGGLRKTGNFEDGLFTAKPGTGWVGAMLVYNLAGNDSNVYTIPSGPYGLSVVSVLDAALNNLDGLLITQQIKNNDGSWTVWLKRNYPAQDIIQFRVLVAVCQVNIDKAGKTKSILRTELMSSVSAQGQKEFVFKAQGAIDAFPSCPPGNYLVYVNGVSKTPESMEIIKNGNLVVKFKEELSQGDRVEIPVFMRYQPEQYIRLSGNR